MKQQPAQKGPQRIRIILVASIFLLVVLSVIASQPELWNGHEVTTEDQGDMVRVVVDGQEYFVQKVSEVFSAEPLLGMLFSADTPSTEGASPRLIADLSQENQAALWAIIESREREQMTTPLSPIVFGKNVSDDPVVLAHLEKNHQFADLEYPELVGEKLIRFFGEAPPAIGLQKDQQRYVVEFGGCDRLLNTCAVRVNGVLSRGISKQEDVAIDSKVSLQITSMQFDTCGGKRFCDYDNGESYDVVEVRVE